MFLPYSAVVDRLESAARQLPGASVIHRGGLAILRLGAESASECDKRPEIWLQGGLHAAERIGPAVVLRLMDELVRNGTLRSCATWYLLPVVDVRGYQRTWAGERFLRTTENGENPNLNFPFRWGEAPALLRLLLGRRLRQWMGPHPGSAACVKHLIAELTRLDNLQLFLDFHGFGRLWLYPWCHSTSPSPHHTDHKAATGTALMAANQVAGASRYRAQPAAHTEVAMGGSCIDFVYGEIGCTHSYAVELPPSLPRGGVTGGTLLGALRGDPKRWWREGQDPDAAVVIQAGDEMVAALSALVDHLFRPAPGPK
ncbi:MAG: M14 family zinc carboxypeptidase [Gemmatimonadales bacterium]